MPFVGNSLQFAGGCFDFNPLIGVIEMTKTAQTSFKAILGADYGVFMDLRQKRWKCDNWNN